MRKTKYLFISYVKETKSITWSGRSFFCLEFARNKSYRHTYINHFPKGLFRANKIPWRDDNTVYKCSREVKPDTTTNKLNLWLDRVLNPRSPDFNAGTPTTRLHCLNYVTRSLCVVTNVKRWLTTLVSVFFLLNSLYVSHYEIAFVSDLMMFLYFNVGQNLLGKILIYGKNVYNRLCFRWMTQFILERIVRLDELSV